MHAIRFALIALSLFCPLGAEASEILKPRTRADLAAFEVADPDRRSTRPARQAVSDFALQLAPGDALALRMANGARPERGRTLFKVRLLVVAGGRLLADGIAACGSWERDLARCEMACDGGGFVLRRAPGDGGAGEVDFVLGSLPQADDSDGPASLSLGDCGLDDAAGPNLVARAGRTLVELPLIGD